MHLYLYINLRRARDVRTYAVRGGRPDAFSSPSAAFTLTVHINALYNVSAHGKEEHST